MSVIDSKYIMNNYQKRKPFSSFLSGISGKKGIPIWTFYVNRGQAISSFGLRDKNKAIMEFQAAVKAYANTSLMGFRTFIKVDGMTYEFFKNTSNLEKMIVEQDKLTIEDINESINIKVTIIYLTLPNENIGGLIRQVKIENLDESEKHIEVLDGLTQILPSGIDFSVFKAVPNLMQSWMDAEYTSTQAFYKLRASTSDSSIVNEVNDGHFMISKVAKTKTHIFVDTKMIFGYDTAFTKPLGFENNSISDLMTRNQVNVNQILCGYVAFEKTLKNQIIINSIFGYTSDKNQLNRFAEKITDEYIDLKIVENRTMIDSLVSDIEVKTSRTIFDQYMKQNYLDNLLRGGVPFVFKTLDGDVAYHLFSRKHGDLERDYNFYVIEPEFYSQGNGNFRDVLQNRRNDVLFHPEIKNHNIRHFFSLIQADGYNPLSIEGIRFNYKGSSIKNLDSVIGQLFSPGQVIKALMEQGHTFEEAEDTLKVILEQSRVEINANFSEGYWQDHFTYLYDLLETYFKVYPETETQVYFEDNFYRFYYSNVFVKPRNKKYVLTPDNKVRQYRSIEKLSGKPKWLMDNNSPIQVNLYSKIITLILNKFGLLDPYGIGLSYESDKPGWNDAMNGLPGLFASGVSEMIELKKLVDLMLSISIKHKNQNVSVIINLLKLESDYLDIKSKDEFVKWDQRSSALEEYRQNISENVMMVKTSVSYFINVLDLMASELNEALKKAKTISPMLPTYLTYEATDYELIDEKNTNSREDSMPFVKVNAFKIKPITEFLESPARYLKTVTNKKEAKKIYELVKNSELYDTKMKFYQTSRPLDEYSNEIGRIRAFTKGWLERESNFLHMTYKYLLGVLKSGLYEPFYKEIETNLVCFMDEDTYGRSPLENSSFIVTSTNPDIERHGQGFVSRLSGSTAEMLSIYFLMFFGNELFQYSNNKLTLTLKPLLPKTFFKDGIVEVKLFNSIITYHNTDMLDTFDDSAVVYKIVVKGKGETKEFKNIISSKTAKLIRSNEFMIIDVYINNKNN